MLESAQTLQPDTRRSAQSAANHQRQRPARRSWQILTKVPKITVYFWIIKLLTTAVGESTSDYLVHQINPYFAVALGFVGFALAMILQFSVRKYIPGVYWLAAAMVAVFGTMVADVMHVGLGIPYAVSAVVFAITLAVVFVWWYKAEGTLSIHSVYTRRRELFYWATVVTTFALGTATGDLAAYTMHLGYLTSGILFAGVFVVPALAYWLFGLNAIFAFWFAYILTRPLGASFADWSAKPHSFGGLGYGDGAVSTGLTILIVVLVGYVTVTHSDTRSRR